MSRRRAVLVRAVLQRRIGFTFAEIFAEYRPPTAACRRRMAA